MENQFENEDENIESGADANGSENIESAEAVYQAETNGEDPLIYDEDMDPAKNTLEYYCKQVWKYTIFIFVGFLALFITNNFIVGSFIMGFPFIIKQGGTILAGLGASIATMFSGVGKGDTVEKTYSDGSKSTEYDAASSIVSVLVGFMAGIAIFIATMVWVVVSGGVRTIYNNFKYLIKYHKKAKLEDEKPPFKKSAWFPFAMSWVGVVVAFIAAIALSSMFYQNSSAYSQEETLEMLELAESMIYDGDLTYVAHGTETSSVFWIQYDKDTDTHVVTVVERSSGTGSSSTIPFGTYTCVAGVWDDDCEWGEQMEKYLVENCFVGFDYFYDNLNKVVIYKQSKRLSEEEYEYYLQIYISGDYYYGIGDDGPVVLEILVADENYDWSDVSTLELRAATVGKYSDDEDYRITYFPASNSYDYLLE